jgi:hypothetical protein
MKNKFAKMALLLFAFGIIVSAIWSNLAAYAQNKTATSIAVPPSSSSAAAPSPKLHSIRITSPTKGQQVPIGENLIASGHSRDNATTSCYVSVIVNNVKPYQNATALAPSGAADYSKWNFVLTSNYTTIKEGANKITAKFSCVNTPAATSPHFYSVNITGVKAGPQLS